MFVLVSLKDTVVIKPNYIGSDMKEIIEQELNSRFCSKVSNIYFYFVEISTLVLTFIAK